MRVVLAFVTLLFAFVTSKGGGGIGMCPAPEDIPTRCYLVPVCLEDADCPTGKKCCPNGCGNDCVDPVVGKKGFCPAPGSIPAVCYREPKCTVDHDCEKKKKCCSNGCSDECLDPVKTKCQSLGGVCKRKNSDCCLELEDSRPDMCQSDKKTCCLPEKGIGGVCPIPKGFGTCVEACSSDYDCAADELCCSNGCGHVCMKPDNPCAYVKCHTCIITGPNCDAAGSCSYGFMCVAGGSENDAICPTPTDPGTCVDLCTTDDDCTGGKRCCSNGCGRTCMLPVCNAKHQESLCKIADRYNLFGNTIYDPYVQVPEGCSNRSAISRGPGCLDPERICLKKPILKLLECANKACEDGITKLELVSILNTDFNAAAPPRDLCDGNTVLLRKPKGKGCKLGKLKKLCEDVGGVYDKVSGTREAYCTLPSKSV